MCGAADVAIVEADNLQPAADERVAEVIGPRNHLRAAAHDEQHHGRIARPEALVRDVDPRRPDLPRDLLHVIGLSPRVVVGYM